MLNKEVLKNFIENKPDKYWDVRGIDLHELGYKHPEKLTVDELADLLDYIYVLIDDEEYIDEAADSEFGIRIKLTDDDTCYWLEMVHK